MVHDIIIKTVKGPRKAALVVIFCAEGAAPEGEGGAIWASLNRDFTKVAAAAGFTGARNTVLDLVAPDGLEGDRLWVVGIGKTDSDTDAKALAASGGRLAARLAATRITDALVVTDGALSEPENLAAFAAGMRLRHYKFEKYRTRKPSGDESPDQPDSLTVRFVASDKSATDKALDAANAVVEGTLLARNLVNEPANLLGPEEFAEAASKLAELGVEVEVLTDEQMEKQGMGALLGVAQGSDRPARMVVMQWHGGKKKDAPTVFVGKGVCFDSGGISIKPAGGMEDMKGDMGGAAAVTGLMRTVALRKAKANVVGVIGLVENLPGPRSYRPGDILTSMSGQTIEIVNTDAEGRLVLCDALWYAKERFKPRAMINLATLTGAILVALGHEHAGLFSNNDDLAGALFAAGGTSGEKVWRMPLSPAYDKMMNSRFADMKNAGGRFAGSITAAQFLQRFVGDVPWAHLDIAGTAFGGPSNDTNHSWGTGYGVALLDRYLRDTAEG